MKLDRSDAAVVGRVVAEVFVDPAQGGPERRLQVDVEQRVKGEVRDDTPGDGKTTLLVSSPQGTDCDLTVDPDRTVGLLVERTPAGGFSANLCSLANPGELVALGGEPRGGPIKVVIGVGILLLVLAWSFRRLKRGARPRLPGAPEP